ncbi:unnamed protein product [Peronospora destructor]|uniref:PB1 domain-containing protein n=1 Tax=Peronospora destructor TaxID=86335 RepID=A0AAV0T4J2_9STRA|nr:unnamed protein product [Peronospora destructor]
MAETVVLKLSYAGETHRSTMSLHFNDSKDNQALSYEVVLAKVREAFPKISGPWTLVYRDDEGDIITLTHALEFNEACHVLLDMTSNDKMLRTLHFSVLSRVSFREKLVAPVLLKVVELAALAREATANLRKSELLGKGRDSIVRLAKGAVMHADVAINHIRNSDVLERGRESLSHSATLLWSARSGVSIRLRRASSAVAAGIERHRSSSGSRDDKGFDSTKFVKVAVDSPSPEVAVTIHLQQSDSLVMPLGQTPNSAENGEEALPAVISRMTVVENGTLWTTLRPMKPRAETNDEWVRELDVLRGILVHVDEEVCCELLSQYNGNIEAVLVELTNV